MIVQRLGRDDKGSKKEQRIFEVCIRSLEIYSQHVFLAMSSAILDDCMHCTRSRSQCAYGLEGEQPGISWFEFGGLKLDFRNPTPPQD